MASPDGVESRAPLWLELCGPMAELGRVRGQSGAWLVRSFRLPSGVCKPTPLTCSSPGGPTPGLHTPSMTPLGPERGFLLAGTDLLQRPRGALSGCRKLNGLGSSGYGVAAQHLSLQ